MAPPGIPAAIGPFRIGREIGRGGMGVVYLARDTRLDRDVAIKALPAALTSDPVQMARLQREAKLLASLNHPNIAAIHALEEHEGARYLILELVEGRTLSEILGEGALPVADALHTCRQIADALEAAHSRGVAHRDLKPANIRITADNRVKVLDFGLAKSLEARPGAPPEDTTLTIVEYSMPGQVMGTPGYMSPEQALGRPVDARTDVWALGCILFECLTGRPAFAGPTAADVLAATLTREPAWDRLPPPTPGRIRALLEECLRKDAEARLRDVSEARQAIEESLGARPTPTTSLARSAAPHNLPAQVTSFVGRGREIEQLRALLSERRMVTLTGSGGCGKTRLAIEVASRLLGSYPDGVWYADLALLADPSLVPKTVASIFHLREHAGESLSGVLIHHLARRSALLVLDNCEHLLGACAALADALVHGCPSLGILATSREATGIAGETVYRVPSLSCPDARAQTVEALEGFEAVELFVERARAAQPSFAPGPDSAAAIAQICRRLDGIPLALELAAARVRVLPPDEIARRLADSFRLLTGGSRTAMPRQQTLRATIDWSFRLLSGDEQALLARLSVFAGGWSLQAAERICSDDAVTAGTGQPPAAAPAAAPSLRQSEILDLLTALVDKSLAVYDEHAGGRYRLLETVRQYAQEELANTPDAARVRDRHLDYFLSMAEQAEPRLRGPDQAPWLERLESDHDNLLAALEWCEVAADGAQKALRLAASLWRFWEIHGHQAIGTKAFEAALGRPGADATTAARAGALNGAGLMASMRGDYRVAQSLFEQSLAIRLELGDRHGIAGSLSNLGVVANNLGDHERARTLHTESLAIRRELADRVGVTTSLICLGNVARAQGRLDEARTLYEEGLEIQRDFGDRYLTAYLTNSLGLVAQALHDPDSARALYARSLATRRSIKDSRGTADTLQNIAALAREQGAYTDAVAALLESLSILREVGDKLKVAASLDVTVMLAASMDRFDEAALLAGAADRLRGVIHAPRCEADQGAFDAAVSSARAALTGGGFDGAFEAGGAMKWQEAMAEALRWLREDGGETASRLTGLIATSR
jgi:non-specific serine/threonine protein kinase